RRYEKASRSWMKGIRAFEGGKGPAIDDSTLVCVRQFPHLKRLALSFTNVGDAGMAHVSELRQLEFLSLEVTDVTDASIPLLAKLGCLRTLDIIDTSVSA